MNELNSQPGGRHHLSILTLVMLTGCKPGSADDTSGAESTGEHEATTSDTTTDDTTDDDTSTTGDGDGEPACKLDECPLRPRR